MFKRLIALAILGLGFGSAPAIAEPYRIDADHSQISFAMNHLGFSVFRGFFRKFDAEIDFDPENIEQSNVTFEIDSGSIDTVSKVRDNHIRSYAELLNTEAFPKITFVSRRIRLTSAETAEMTGDLTIKDQTHEQTFNIRLNKSGESPLSPGRNIYGFTATGEVDRVKFGMGFAAPAVSGVIPVQISLEILPVN